MCSVTCDNLKVIQNQKREIIKFRAEAQYWHGRFKDRIGREEALKEKIKELQAKLRYLKHQFFGRKRENGFDNDRTIEHPQRRFSGKRGQRFGSKGHGRRRYDGLPVKVVNHYISEGEKVCPVCGRPRRCLTLCEESEEIEWEVRVYRKRHRRKRYAKVCDCPEVPAIITAPVAKKLIPKGLFSVGFWTKILINKYYHQISMGRIIQSLRLHGLQVSPGTITGGLQVIQKMIEPLYNGIVAHVQKASYMHIDETRWYVFVEIEGKAGYLWWLWVYSTASAVLYVIDTSRSSSVPKQYVGKQEGIILSVDRYSAYKKLKREHDGDLLLAFCWSHVRRDFIDSMKSWDFLEEWAMRWIKLIGNLYHLNNKRLHHPPNSDEYRIAHNGLQTAIIDMEKVRDQELLQPDLHPGKRKVLSSLKDHWEGLTIFIDHPHIPMDNNEAERCLRNPVLGRKNYYGSMSKWSGKFCAMMFTILQTVSRNGLNPEQYLENYFQHCAANGGKAPEDVSPFLLFLNQVKVQERPHPVTANCQHPSNMFRVTSATYGNTSSGVMWNDSS